jgi:hypothetical protein
MEKSIIEQIREGAEPGKVVDQLGLLAGDQLEQTINTLATMKDTRTAQVLALFSERIQDKKLRKSVKKVLFHLKTQGIRFEEPGRTEDRSILKKVETERESRALFSNYDPEQTRAIVVACELKKNQFLFTQVVSHFSNGLVDLQSFPVARKELDPILKEYREKIRRPVVVAPISAPYAGYLIEEAARTSGQEMEEARGLHHLLRNTKGEVERPADVYRLQAPSDTPASSTASILSDEIFEPFLLSWPGMEEDRNGLAEVVNPSIVLPPYVIQERREAFLKKLTEEERLMSRTVALRRMLEDTAYLFHGLGQFGHHKGLLEILKSPQSIITALVYFVQKTLSDLDRKAQQQQPEVSRDPHSLMKK